MFRKRVAGAEGALALPGVLLVDAALCCDACGAAGCPEYTTVRQQNALSSVCPHCAPPCLLLITNVMSPSGRALIMFQASKRSKTNSSSSFLQTHHSAPLVHCNTPDHEYNRARCLLHDHHSQLQAAGLTQSSSGVGMSDATQCLSIYGQHLISFLDRSLLSCQAAGEHFFSTFSVSSSRFETSWIILCISCEGMAEMTDWAEEEVTGASA
ncbi:hypothetical protein INR49_031563 [Caranx melampygus]|nr:hypothetical protein INR49_031563 [Caranx melampygus]